VSAIPPVEPVIPGHGTRLVRRRTPEEEPGEQPHAHEEEFHGEEADLPEDEDDGGLPHVDVRV
jgi:hypothetical protein